jgi:nucleoside-triphosphatase THEP1
MKLQIAKRNQTKMRVAIQGASGSGKTFSSLQLAYGLCSDFSRVAVIDTEDRSSTLYAHLGEYRVLPICAPYTPEVFIEAIEKCENESIDVIIIDSISHEWEGEGGVIEIHSSMLGNSFSNWSKVMPRHNALIKKILNSKCHIIVTMRSKHEYVLSDKNGKSVAEKVGMKAVQKDGIEYDFTVLFELDGQHYAKCTKDRTQIFSTLIPYRLTENSGQEMKRWCIEGENKTDADYIKLIRDCITLEELKHLYDVYPEVREYALEFDYRAAVIKGEMPELSNKGFIPKKPTVR